jgi:hypothetical protein
MLIGSCYGAIQAARSIRAGSAKTLCLCCCPAPWGGCQHCVLRDLHEWRPAGVTGPARSTANAWPYFMRALCLPNPETRAGSIQWRYAYFIVSFVFCFGIPSIYTFLYTSPTNHQSRSNDRSLRAAMEDFSKRSWTAKDWAAFFSNQPTVRDIIDMPGLPAVARRGMPKFTEPELCELHSEVQKLSCMLPTNRDDLLQSAASRISGLNNAMHTLLCTLGPRIWGQAADRTRLLADPGTLRRRHRKTLVYEDLSDRQM